jgi:hypothetical protein
MPSHTKKGPGRVHLQGKRFGALNGDTKSGSNTAISQRSVKRELSIFYPGIAAIQRLQSHSLYQHYERRYSNLPPASTLLNA